MKRSIKAFRFKTLNASLVGRTLPVFFLFLIQAFYASAGSGINERTRFSTHQISPDSVVLSFDNDLSVPVTVNLALELDNLEGDYMSGFTVTVPAKKTKYPLARFKKPEPAKPYQCSYTWKIVMGDVSQVPDLDYLYLLPFQKRSSYKISQGPGGAISHKDIFAYDFAMPVGTPIIAARDGIIAAVKSDSSIGGPFSVYSNDANFISIYHSDGTIANYFHLKKDGVVVNEGQEVKRGDLIGYSGSTGFSSGPHLHFEVVRPGPDFEKNQSIVFSWDTSGTGSKKTIRGYR